MDLEIGSNRYRNTDGTVEIEGVPQFEVSLPKAEGPIALNGVLYDTVGRVILKLVGSAIAFNERRAFELTKTPTGVTLKNLETGKQTLRVELKEPGVVCFKEGEFLTVRAHQMTITPTEWRLDKHRMSGKDSDLGGKPVAIG